MREIKEPLAPSLSGGTDAKKFFINGGVSSL